MSYFYEHLTHTIKACLFSISGLRFAYKDEIAFRQISLLLLTAFVLSVWLGDSWVEVILLILPPCISVIVELLNTAIENVVDLVQPEWSLLAKKAKDTASAAQFCSQLLSCGVWATFLISKFI